MVVRNAGKNVTQMRRVKTNLPSKICKVCGRPFNWRKKWVRCWDEVRYCSKRCSGMGGKLKNDYSREN